MTSYYNEIDKPAAAWLRELIKAGHIADGIVDERDIQDVLPSDLAGFTQCHFFAGVAAWSYALRKAGWSDDRPVWTGSCPCQPFSSAGKGSAFADERHLWPAFHHLIKECRPPVVFGEQVASKDADTWIDLVQTDLEAVGYAVGAVPFPAASVGAPHIRDRLYWVGDSSGALLEGYAGNGCPAGREGQKRSAAETSVPSGLADLHSYRRHQAGQRVTEAGGNGPVGDGTAGGLGHADRIGAGRDGRPVSGQVAGQDGQHIPIDADASGGDGWMADTQHDGCGGQESHQAKPNGNRENFGLLDRGHFAPQGQPATGPTNGYWRDADWLFCRDGKWRPVEPGSFPLVDGAAARVVRGGSDGLPIDSDKTGEARVMRLRGYGNSINAVAAKAFIESFMDYQQQVSA